VRYVRAYNEKTQAKWRKRLCTFTWNECTRSGFGVAKNSCYRALIEA